MPPGVVGKAGTLPSLACERQSVAPDASSIIVTCDFIMAVAARPGTVRPSHLSAMPCGRQVGNSAAEGRHGVAAREGFFL